MNHLVLITLLGLVAAGCAAVVPPELIDARAALQRASAGPAARLSPDELHTAQEALAAAERAFEDHPRSYQAVDAAYVAHRKSQLAEVLAAIALERQQLEDDLASYQDARRTTGGAVPSALGTTPAARRATTTPRVPRATAPICRSAAPMRCATSW